MARVLTAPYRRILATPGARPLYALALVARIPVAAAPVALTLRVVLGLHRGFAQSGLIAAAVALGMAAGAPLLGRLVDRRGARTVLAITTLAQATFWVGAAILPYRWLVPAAFLGGALSIPVSFLPRQAVAALLPERDRRAGLALDSMGVEVAYSIGPALGVLAVTRFASATGMLLIGAGLVAAGVGLFLLDPPLTPRPTQSVGQASSGARATAAVAAGLGKSASRGWLGPPALAALAATMGATLTLTGTDLSLTGAMRAFDHLGLLGVVMAVWCMASLAGGFAYGALPRGRDPLLLLVLLAGLTLVLALAGSWWSLLLLTIPSGLFCAPLISSTANVMSSVAAPQQRGRALGAHAAALTLGNAAGAPLAGWVIDRWSPASGFVAVGVLGMAVALVALALQSRHNPALGLAHLLEGREVRAAGSAEEVDGSAPVI